MNTKQPGAIASGRFMGQDDTYTLGPMQSGPACCEPQPLIEVENFSLSYGARAVLENLSLNIYRGCITALIGPSGCGKTSFLSSINRLTDLIPGCRVGGRIRIDNCDIHDPAVRPPRIAAEDWHGLPEAHAFPALNPP